jgi:hypothetical protein
MPLPKIPPTPGWLVWNCKKKDKTGGTRAAVMLSAN